MKIKMVIISVVILLYALLVLADAPVVDISQRTSGQIASTIETEANDTSDVSTSTAAAPLVAVPATQTENLVPSSAAMLTETDLTESQRLARLEQQIDNITNINLPQQIIDLQQELAQIRGQLQVQKHNFQLLDNQQRSFYQDLDQRITELKNLNSADTSGSISSTKSSGNSVVGNRKIQLQDSNAYQVRLDLLTKKQYKKAEAAFQKYLDDYPNGSYVESLRYWLGEIYLQQKNTHKAAFEFQVIWDKFLKSEKMLDAKLKLAIIHAEMGKIAEARRELVEIKKHYPESTVTKLANIHLKQLEVPTSTLITPNNE